MGDKRVGTPPSNEALIRAKLLAQASAYQGMAAMHANAQFPPGVNPLAAAAAANMVRMQQAVMAHGPAAMMAVARHGGIPNPQHYSRNESSGPVGSGEGLAVFLFA